MSEPLDRIRPMRIGAGKKKMLFNVLLYFLFPRKFRIRGPRRTTKLTRKFRISYKVKYALLRIGVPYFCIHA